MAPPSPGTRRIFLRVASFAICTPIYFKTSDRQRSRRGLQLDKAAGTQARAQITCTANSKVKIPVSLFAILLQLQVRICIQISIQSLHFHRATLQLSSTHATHPPPNRLRGIRVIAPSVRSSAPTDLPRTWNRAPSRQLLSSTASKRRIGPTPCPSLL